jgi:ribosome-binding ATPase YchF (GTP1/OBG family)
VQKVRDYAKTHLACEAVVISAQIESDLVDLEEEARRRSSPNSACKESGVGALIRATYHLLGLRTYFTAGEKEVRAWTIHAGDTAPKAAGRDPHRLRARLHQGRDRGLRGPGRCGSVAAAREKGLYRMEGKEYVVEDGDVLLFKFNV